MLALLILLTFYHFEIKFILVFHTCFKLKFFDLILFFMIVFRSLFVIFFLLQKPKLLSFFGLASFTVLSLRNAIFKCRRHLFILNMLFKVEMLVDLTFIIFHQMGKKDAQKQPKNKGHKTLRTKLKKKRELLKQHKKQKRLKHQKYDPEAKKTQFFEQKTKALKQGQVKEKKVAKYIKKFINIYEEDLEDFYEIFSTFDKKGEIDISQIENKSLQKCLKKMFKYLPLQKKKMIYTKKEGAQTKLQPYMRNNVSGIIEQYLQNGTDSQQQKGQWESSSDEGNDKKQKIVKFPKVKKRRDEQQGYMNVIKSNPHPIQQENMLGPLISSQDRLRIAQAFQKQLEQQKQQAKQKQAEQENQFSRIFGMSSQRKNKKKQQLDQKVPVHLLAQGSAQIGEKMQIDQDYMAQYDREHRPKKLIDMHRQMMNLNKDGQPQGGNKQRKPFDRERDIVNGRFREKQKMMTNSMFFDFKDKMTKPKGTNNFL